MKWARVAGRHPKTGPGRWVVRSRGKRRKRRLETEKIGQGRRVIRKEVKQNSVFSHVSMVYLSGVVSRLRVLSLRVPGLIVLGLLCVWVFDR